MKKCNLRASSYVVLLVLTAVLTLGLIRPMTAKSQDTGNEDLASQVRQLQAKVAALEAAMQKQHPGEGVMGGMTGHPIDMQGTEMMGRHGTAPTQPMGSVQGGRGMSDGGTMQGMGSERGGAGGMGMGGMGNGGGMGMMGMEGMMGQNPAGQGMGMMRGRMRGMALPSALPGFPGASHLYHIGATDFFLDHPQHITLTTEQQTALNQIKERTLMAQADTQRKIDQAEEELWELTGADQPNAAKIESKVRDIERLRGDQRLAFIRAVGEAAKVLTPDQVKSLVGQMPAAGQGAEGTAPASPAHQHQP